MDTQSKIFVAGHNGLVGSAIVRALAGKGPIPICCCAPAESLTCGIRPPVDDFFATEKPDYVFLAAAKVGGIHANNTYRAEFLYDNLMIEGHHYPQRLSPWGGKAFVFGNPPAFTLRWPPQPMKEEHLLTGFLEADERALCDRQNRRSQTLRKLLPPVRGSTLSSAMPTNLYGINGQL